MVPAVAGRPSWARCHRPFCPCQSLRAGQTELSGLRGAHVCSDLPRESLSLAHILDGAQSGLKLWRHWTAGIASGHDSRHGRGRRGKPARQALCCVPCARLKTSTTTTMLQHASAAVSALVPAHVTTAAGPALPGRTCLQQTLVRHMCRHTARPRPAKSVLSVCPALIGSHRDGGTVRQQLSSS